LNFGGPLLPAGDFPSFLRKTDEVLAQKVPWMLEWMQRKLCGPGIQKNPLGLSEHRIFVFDIYDFKTCAYINPAFVTENGFWEKLSIPRVAFYKSFDLTLDQLQEFASRQKYPNGKAAEGIVVRTLDKP
jgi:hypothetical protein